MSDLSGAVAPFLSTLRTLPVWILIGLAVVGWIVLFAPAASGIELASFRQQWGVWVWIESIAFSVLSVARVAEAGFRAYWSHKTAAAARRVLRFVPLHDQCWWHLAKQQDDSYVSQIRMDIQVSNTSERPVQIIKVQLLRPRAELLQADASLPMRGSPYHSFDHPAPPRGTERAAVHILVRGALAAAGKPLRIALRITDQYGEEYTLRNLTVKPDQPRRKPTLSERVQRLKFSVALLFRRNPRVDEPQTPVMPWAYDAGPESVSIAESILAEEKRSYAARGRRTGGLGSLNVGLQSEPNYGWTTQGEIPKLLWATGKGTPVTSPNLERLLRVHSALNATDRDNLERYLLTQLCKESPFAEVAYFVFLALHRMGRTIDALTTARKFLSGDKVFAYSNLIGTFSAVISHEHYDTDPSLYPLVLDALTGDEEPDFKLREKVNCAQLEFLDRERASSTVEQNIV